jgi:hypothetical protein
MLTDRLAIRAWKLLIILGAASLLVEAVFELKLLVNPLINPPSVPGQSKIIEHFLIQHCAFPLMGLLLVFAPSRLIPFVQDRLVAIIIASLAILVSIPEAIVSRTDLFRPYPFDLPEILTFVQMMPLGSVQLNLLQLQHLLCSHLALMGGIVFIVFAGLNGLRFFAGPHTGAERFA